MSRLRVFVPLMMLAVFAAPIARAADKPDRKPDPRLDQKITYEAKSLPVSKVLQELTDKTKVRMIAGGSSKDWQVRDRRMNLFVKDTTLADLQKNIADLMHFHWSSGVENGEIYYRLWQDKRSVDEEEAKRRKAEQAKAEREHKRRQEAYDSFKGLDDMTPEQIEKLKQDNPYLYAAAKTGIAKGLGQFFSNSPSAMSAIMGNQESTMRMQDLSPVAQQGLQTAVQGIMKVMGGRAASNLQKLADGLPSATINLNRSKQAMAGTPFGGIVLGDISIRAEGGGHFDLPILDPNSDLAKTMGRMATKVMDGESWETATQGMQGQFMAAVASDLARDAEPAEKEEPQPPDPELEKKIELKIDPGLKLVQTLKELSKAASMTVISDQFPGTSFGIVKIDEKEIAIKDAVDKIAKGYNCSWRKEGSVIRLQDKDWSRKRAAQIPDAWIEGWTDTLKKTGTLSLDDAASIASLTDEQINMNLRGDIPEPLRAAIGPLAGAKDILRFYGSLDRSQKAAISSEHGLGAHLLTPEQWSMLERQIRPRNASLVPNPPIPLAVTLAGRKIDERMSYTFYITSPESEQTASWTVAMPKYEPPEEATPPAGTEKKP